MDLSGRDDRAALAILHARIHIAAHLTARSDRTAILRCQCRDSTVMVWVARGAVQHTSLLGYN